MRFRITGRQLLILVTIAVTVLAVVTAFHDVPAVGRALRDFDRSVLPLAIALGAAMHLLRFTRWQLYAGRVAGRELRFRDSLLIYGAGLGTHLTPGRIGEAVRCTFLRRAAGTPVARSAPIMLAERVMDGVGLLGLALPGALFLGLGGPAAAILLTLPLLLVPVLASHRAHAALLGWTSRLPFTRRHLRHVRDASVQLREFLTPALLVPAVLLSLAAMAVEVGTFGVILAGVGVHLSGGTYVRAGFILPAAMLASTIFLVPGNLGVAEGGIAALTRTVLSVSTAGSAAAAVLVRLCTLWLGLLAGSVALAVATRRWGSGNRDR